MTTPDTLASLIAKWRKEDFLATASYCADKVEAAIDALATKWESLAEISHSKYPKACYSEREIAVLRCAAELRGRGASESH